MENGTGSTSLPPSSSPRLPSPPPFTEVQIGPASPTVGDNAVGQHDRTVEGDGDAGAVRRIRPGTKARDMASGPPLVPLPELESAFQLQEHLKALHKFHTHPTDGDHTVALNRETAEILATPPAGVDPGLWLYEITRLLTIKLNTVVVALFNDSPPCSAATCPEMRASEWQYLCAVHDPPKSCCAIDYCCHTLDHAAGILTSSKHFPSRLSLGMGGEGGGRHQGERHLTSIFRRLYRIFAHAWFQHRRMFWQIEGEHGLYVFFKTVSDRYSLIPEDTYTVPPEAEGIDVGKALDEPLQASIVMLKKNEDGEGTGNGETAGGQKSSNIRRHKSTPSTTLLTTTVEVPEEEDEALVAQKLPETDVAARGVLEAGVMQAGSEKAEKEVETRTVDEVGKGEKDEEARALGNEEQVVEEVTEAPVEREIMKETAAATVQAKEETDQEDQKEKGDDISESDCKGIVEVEASSEESA
jgi:Mob1/phocein family